MKKSILNLGNALNKAEQKNIYGGAIPTPIEYTKGGICRSDSDCISNGVVLKICYNFYCTYEGNIILD